MVRLSTPERIAHAEQMVKHMKAKRDVKQLDPDNMPNYPEPESDLLHDELLVGYRHLADMRIIPTKFNVNSNAANLTVIIDPNNPDDMATALRLSRMNYVLVARIYEPIQPPTGLDDDPWAGSDE